MRANGELLAWRRDPVNVYAFHVEVPAGVDAARSHVPVSFADADEPRPDRRDARDAESAMGDGAAVSGRPLRFADSDRADAQAARRLAFRRSARRRRRRRARRTRFAETDLETLVDSPLFAGAALSARGSRSGRRAPRAAAFVRRPARPARGYATSRSAAHRNLVQQAYRLFGSQHYDRYEFLLALTDRMGGIGLEHHRSSENGSRRHLLHRVEPRGERARPVAARDGALVERQVPPAGGSLDAELRDADARQLALGLRRAHAVLRRRAGGSLRACGRRRRLATRSR